MIRARSLMTAIPLLLAASLCTSCSGGGGGGGDQFARACDLLNEADVEDAVGNGFEKVEPSDTKRACSYSPANPLDEVRAFLQVSPPDLCDFVHESLVKVDEPVPGLAERASIGVNESGDDFQVDIVACNPDVVINLTLDGGADEKELRNAAIGLVNLALDRFATN